MTSVHGKKWGEGFLKSLKMLVPSYGKLNADQINQTVKELLEITGTLDADERAPLEKQLLAAEKRFNDDKLNLAIIGEFSCGKSTFINALFQKEVLSTNFQPTTAVPTYITWDHRGDDYFVRAVNVEGISYPLVDDIGRKDFERYTGIELPTDSERLIDAVTTDNRLTGKIARVEVAMPKKQAYAGIRLIDTPGVNPGMEGTEEHVHVTQEVLHDESDAAVIMFPYDHVFTNSFTKFLDDNAVHLLKRSIFAITKCDFAKTPNDLREVKEHVEGLLVRMGVEKPEVHCISASYALDVYLADMPVNSSQKEWHKRFEKTIDSVFKTLANRRRSIVCDNITDVINRLTLLLTTNLNEEKKRLDTWREELECYSPQRMETECNNFLEDVKRKMSNQKGKYTKGAENIVNAAIQSAKADVYEEIDHAWDKESVSDIMEGFKEGCEEYISDALKKHVRSLDKELKNSMEEYRNKMEECYKKYHLNVSTSGVSVVKLAKAGEVELSGVQMGVAGFMVASREFEKAMDYIEDNVLDADNIVEGVLSLAAGVIALPFMAVGAIWNAIRSLDSIKSEAKSRINVAMENNRAALLENLKTTISNVAQKYRDAATDLPKEMVKMFQTEFAVVKEKHDREVHENEIRTQRVNEHLGRLSEIAARLGV